ncbi:MAG TPA: polysaccharide deacetylase family protein [Clostridiaceae bacterium]|nr:polysaccharide deacetylase family protein [Clostridiaceae bacterium]
MYINYSKQNGEDNISQNDIKNNGSENQNLENNNTIEDNTANDNTNTNDTENNETENNDSSNDNETRPPIDLSVVKPNESGKIMVVMFHNFIKEYKSGDKEFTTTFDEFRKLLDTLYEKDYRLISLSDYLNNNISVPAGFIPMVFTFDDGTSGQFNLIEKDGTLVANPDSAVGILEEFNKTHPDFGLKGTFFVNLGLNTFPGAGTLTQRLEYLINKGFEIGNHTYTHIRLNEAKTAEEVQREIGGNYKKMLELVPGYKMSLFSLPYGLPASDLRNFVIEGEFEGIKYQNKVIVEVGANPALSPVSKDFNPLSTPRVRSQGIEPVYMDLTWWLENLSREEQYVSDGDPDTITVPKEREHLIDKSKLEGRNLIIY